MKTEKQPRMCAVCVRLIDIVYLMLKHPKLDAFATEVPWVKATSGITYSDPP